MADVTRGEPMLQCILRGIERMKVEPFKPPICYQRRTLNDPIHGPFHPDAIGWQACPTCGVVVELKPFIPKPETE